MEMELQIVHDGPITEEEQPYFDEIAGCLPIINVFEDPEKNGYYCCARNRAFPHAWGFYIAHMDADNEWRPNHLTGLLEAIRIPTDQGWPHFVYSRREYVRDEGASENMPVGKSPLVPWTQESRIRLDIEPTNNFIDTGDFLIGKGTLVELAERTGIIWNSELRRFADWDIVNRLSKAGFRGKPVDQITHIYHWTGRNLQTTRPLQGQDTVMMPADQYEILKRTGAIVDGQRRPGDA
jgi:hypothetical protein